MEVLFPYFFVGLAVAATLELLTHQGQLSLVIGGVAVLLTMAYDNRTGGR